MRRARVLHFGGFFDIQIRIWSFLCEIRQAERLDYLAFGRHPNRSDIADDTAVDPGLLQIELMGP